MGNLVDKVESFNDMMIREGLKAKHRKILDTIFLYVLIGGTVFMGISIVVLIVLIILGVS